MSADPDPGEGRAERRHHAVIAGTGRAGTSFLVRFLGECGLNVGPADGHFDDRARAGLEHHILDENAPYVVKDPWLFAYCDEIDPDVVEIDALLVPVRELIASATSRVLQDRIAMADGQLGRWAPSDVNGLVTGGVVYSLDPVDQARILAVGFHRLIHWATSRQIPLFLLEFPRTVTDGAYLIDTLWPWLGAHCDRARADAAFASIADPRLVRIKRGDSGPGVTGPKDPATLDRDAMAILLKERNSLLAGMEDQLAEVREALATAEYELDIVRAALAATEGQLVEARESRLHTEARLTESQGVLAAVQHRLATSEDQVARGAAAEAAMERHLDATAAELQAIRHTVSWRITRPLRWLR